jgi:type IV pilus assembly protein PilA
MVVKKQLKKSRKGFTLVEVIVVLVILAILAAIAIPALTGYIDKANEKAVISQTRTAVVAAQTIISDAYGAGNKTPTAGAITLAEITKYTGDTSITSVGGIIVTGNAVRQLAVRGGNKTGYFFQGAYSTTPPALWATDGFTPTT